MNRPDAPTGDHARSRRLYRVLLRAWPRGHRDRYGAEMEDAFVALMRADVARHGRPGAIRCWLGALFDSVRGLAVRIDTMRGGGRSNEGRGEHLMGTIIADVRYAIRSLTARPVFALTASLTIAIGIGANASIFTIVNGFMFTPLPYEDSEELVAIWAANPELGWDRTDVSRRTAWDWRTRASTLADLAVINEDGFNLTGGDTPELVSALRVTPNYLSLIGRAPSTGRDFTPDEIGPGGADVAILTDGFWARRFGRDPGVLGSTLILDGAQVTVIGIMPPDYLHHGDHPDLIRPWGIRMEDASRDNHNANAVARLAPGADLDAAREELTAISRELASEYPEEEGWTTEVHPLTEDVVGDIASQASVVLMGAVGFILLMACVNVANLLLARGGGRAREIAVRQALGAGRARIVRQLLTESLVLAAVGGVVGLISANWGYRAIVAALPPSMPPIFQFEMNGDVLAYTAAITVGSALLFGMLPALRTVEGGPVLREARRTGQSRRSTRFGSALVVLQTAMAVVLLAGGGLLMKSIAGMRAQDFGFQPENVLTARISPPSSEYGSREEADAYWDAVIDRVRAVPGIIEVGTTQSHPLMGSNWSRTLRIAGDGRAEDQDVPVRLTYASPGLFEALRFGMAQGRTFDETDDADAPSVVIVNEEFVERYLGPEDDPLSQTLVNGDWSAQVVGVVHDVIERGLDSPPEPSMYVPVAQTDLRTRSLVMRTQSDPLAAVQAMQQAVWAVDADIPVYNIQTMDALVEDRVGGFAVIGTLMGVFALLSLILGAVGIYGVTAYAAGQRTSEIGVRLAMGAERTDVVSMVVREGARRTVLGLGLGLVLALGMGGAMSGILIGVSPRDPLVFGSVLAMLSVVSFGGLYIPARRAARVDPVVALSAE